MVIMRCMECGKGRYASAIPSIDDSMIQGSWLVPSQSVTPRPGQFVQIALR